MENITNDIKSKVFAVYLGSKAVTRLRGYNLEEKRTSTFKEGVLMCVDLAMSSGQLGVLLDEEKVKENLTHLEAGTDCQLILKPLSFISDQDAIEVAKLLWPNDSEYQKAYDGNYYIENMFFGDDFEMTALNAIKVSQFLISKSYDLPQYLLGGKTLHECNLAIYQ